MGRALVALLSDPHLSQRRGHTTPAWRAVADQVAAVSPSVAIVAGDLVFDDCDDGEDHAFAAEAVAALAPQVLVVPGNHDVGDNVSDPWMGRSVSAQRVERFVRLHRSDRFSIDIAGWRVIGVNAQLFGTDLPREADQWTWLADAVHDAGRRPIALVCHKPFSVWNGSEDDQPNCVARAARERLQALAGARIRLVVSGHYHHHRALVLDGATHLWLPSATMVGRATHGFGPVGIRTPGFVALRLDGEDASFAMIATPPEYAFDPVPLEVA
ncbi:metallophosphoesterase family protein [Chelatococcus sp. GCM10030263]|uniref:metallophosphoesterase family protein n=1 Tax=Chelatococcus sp. GCM10030263 TaxID=3273387 RepID=UPI00361A7B90